MDERQVMHAMGVDDAYQVERVLARGNGGVTELVTIDGAGPFVRKKIPLEQAHRLVWAALADAPSPRLPHVEASYELPDSFVVVYDYVVGRTLEERVSAGGPIPTAQACAIAQEVCQAAATLHGLGIVHRDISPKNVILAADGAHLIDLGIARVPNAGAQRDTAPLGTWGFASPEQHGFSQTDARSDVYSIGRLLGYMLTGVRPDDDGYASRLANPKVVPDWLQLVVDKACAFEPSARYQTAADLAAALAQADADPAPDTSAATLQDDASPAPVAGEKNMPFSPKDVDHKGDASTGLTSVKPVADKRPRLVWVLVAVGLLAAVLVVLTVTGVFNRLGSSEGGSVTTSVVSGADDATSGVGYSLGRTLGEEAAAAAIADANGTNPNGSKDVPADAKDLEVVESCFSPDGYGGAHLGVAVKNPNDNYRVSTAEVTATGRDADGNILFSTPMYAPRLFPGQTVYLDTGMTGDTEPATIDFSIRPGRWLKSSEKSTGLSVRNLTEHRDSYGGLTFTYEVVAADDFAPRQSSLDSVMLALVLRDSSGKMVYCQGDYLSGWPEPGSITPYEAFPVGAPDFATAECYAQP